MRLRDQAVPGARLTLIGASFALFTAVALAGPATLCCAAAPGSALDAATREALALADTIERAEEDALALQERIDAVNAQIMSQQSVLAQSESDLQQAEMRFHERVVRMYKSGVANPLAVLISARSLSDLWASASVLSRILSDDSAAFRDAHTAGLEAAYQSARLDDLKADLVQLRNLHTERLAALEAALSRQRLLVANLTAASRALLIERQTARKRSRAEWQASSIPLGTKIALVPATVRPYADRTYLVAAHQPKRYRSTGRSFAAVCSWYGGIFNGRRAASGQIYNMNDLTCASRTLPFGTRLALTREGRRVIVVVTDRGPFIAGRDLDLSYAAARALGFSGVTKVQAEFVETETP